MLFDRFKENVERGEAGANTGLLTSLPIFNTIVYGLQKKTYYLIGAEVKMGKTAFVDQLFVLDAYDSAIAQGKKLRLFYYSLEIDADSKLSKFVAAKIFRDHGIITSEAELVSKGGFKLKDNPRLKRLAYDTEAYFNKMFESVTILDNGINPTGIFNEIDKYCKANGTVREVKKVINGVETVQKVYVQNNPDEYVVFIVDHIGLLKKEHEKQVYLTKKQTIDKLSEYCVWLRNNYSVTPVLISQFNRSLSDIDRQRFKELRPLLSDFKETGNPAEDANVIIALFQPFRYNISTYGDGRYNVAKLGARFNTAHILANRNGDAGAMIGLNFLGECGQFRQFPQRELTEQDYQNAIAYKPFK